MTKQIKIKSAKNSLESFDWKTWVLSFQRPFIILVVYLVGLIAKYPELAPIVLILGGSSVIAERLWSIIKFYVTEYK